MGRVSGVVSVSGMIIPIARYKVRIPGVALTWSATNGGLRDAGVPVAVWVFRRKGRKRQKKGEKGRFRPISGKGCQTLGHGGKYGCRKVQVYPAECGEQLGRDPSKKWELQIPCFKKLWRGREHLGTHPRSSPSHFGIRLHFVRPHFPSP